MAAIVLVFVLFAKFFPIVSVWELEEEEELEEKAATAVKGEATPEAA